MMLRLPFELKIPILYVNPPIHADPTLIREVANAGGLGIIDTVAGQPIEISGGFPYGVRTQLAQIHRIDSSNIKAILLPLEDADQVKNGSFKNVSIPVLVEVANAKQALAAQEAGASGLIARGNEGLGWVSETNGLVLLQQIITAVKLPVFLQGGIDLRTAKGAVSAGATGVVLDVHLLLAEDSNLDPFLKKFLGSLDVPATTVLSEITGSPIRVYSRVGTKIVRELRKLEESISPENYESYRERINSALTKTVQNPDTDDALLPLSEDIRAAQKLAREFKTAANIVAAFGKRMCEPINEWPLHRESPICKDHGTSYPIVQGPMAHVSDNPDFLAAVKNAGALPFLAMGNMPAPIAREAITLARQKTGGQFGVGLIGLEVNRKCYEAHLEIMQGDPPPYAILAAGTPDLARRIEAMGTTCYLHCPSPAVLNEALKAGLRHFVFEGCESGGHIGALGSLNLWSANLAELESAASEGIPLSEVTVLFAGGIATGRAATFIAGMAADLVAKGLKIGLQMGTAYLACKEAVSTCAITPTYQKLVLESNATVVIGRTVNTRARAACSPMASKLMELEQDRLRKGISLRERKELYEKDNLGCLRLASKGCAIDPETATWDCPVFCDLPPEEQLNRGLFLMGQVVCLLNETLTIEKLHASIIEEGRQIFDENMERIRSAFSEKKTEKLEPEPLAIEYSNEPIAVVGIGLRFPGAASPSAFWDLICSKRSGIVEVPKERWGNPELYFDPDPKVPDKTYTKIGGFILDFSFDPLAYRIPPAVAKKMDRPQQMAVTCVADALADAGFASPAELKGRRVAIILGNSMGGENTELYGERVKFPRAVACLEKALDSLGIDQNSRKNLINEFRATYLSDLPEITEDSLPGELANVISGRVANVFNLEGPNFTVDAACASSIAAVMNAVTALRNRSIDLAISGGVDAAMHPSSFVKFCKIGALSPDGSRPFDEAANGFVMGEGAGILILKRLSDAIRDGNKIYATILEVGSSSDGKGKGITAPNATGQERALRACFDAGRIDPRSIGLIEAHGTSTPVGDATELMVLDRFFRASGLPKHSVGVGSVKSQIGHLKAAAGAAGMIKAILSLHNRCLPPTINVENPNKCIDWDTSPLFLITDAVPWTTDNGFPRRAGVSAFGFGGTNFHIVFQEHTPGLQLIPARKKKVDRAEISIPAWPKPSGMKIDGEAWVIGGNDPAELAEKIENVLKGLSPENYLKINKLHRDEAASFAIRCGFGAIDVEMASKKLAIIKEGLLDPAKMSFFPARGIHVAQGEPKRHRPGIAFLFPGQGSQYPFMLRDLAERYHVVAATLAEADEILASLGLPGVTSNIFVSDLEDEGREKNHAEAMKDTQILQPMILTANTAIFRLLAQFNIKPVACAGHSLGEYAACVAAGVFSFRDAVQAVAVRGREMARVSISDPGLMMSIPADARLVEEVLAEVDGYVVAANKNSPKQTVISGETAAVKKAGELFKARGLEGVLIPVSAAFHSGVVAPAREPFMKTLERLTVNPPTVPILSNVTGDYYPIGPAAPDNIRDLLGKQFAAPVEWVKIQRKLYSDGIRIFVECGPKRVMTNLALDTLPNDILALPTNHPKKGGILQLMETLAALAVEGVPVSFDSQSKQVELGEMARRREKPELKVVASSAAVTSISEPQAAPATDILEGLLDAELKEIARQKEFSRFLEFQGEPIRQLIKSGFKAFIQNVMPLEKTVRQIKSEGMNFEPVAISGIAAGLPSDVRFPFDRETLDDLILGRNFIKKVPESSRHRMLEKNVERLIKGPSGEATLQIVNDTSGVIQLAGYFGEEDLINEYGLDERIVKAMDVTTRLAVAAGIEALKDAGIPLLRMTRVTSTGHELPDAWALPPALREETGVIFASAFPGMASLVDEVTRQTASRYGSGAKKRLIEFYTGLVNRIGDDREREKITKWFTEEFSRLNPEGEDELYTFNRDFLLRVMSMGHGQMAQLIKAQGPNTHVDAACAATTQAIILARDWIRAGHAKRVLVIAADDVAGKTLLPWIGSGFLAMGAATTNGKVAEAALPFDDRRHGLILGSAAIGMVIESQDLVKKRGMDSIATIEAGLVANSGFHGTRLDVEHISSMMEKMISKWEKQSGLSRRELAKNVFFMSHETYSPKRGGSSAAEVKALRDVFGDQIQHIPIANTKGFTGHTMGVGVEDVVALRCLQKQILPPIPNLKQPDPEFSDLNLSRGGLCKADYALRLAAGFGSQIVMALYKAASRDENRISDLHTHRNWLKEVTNYVDPVVFVESRSLRVMERPVEKRAAEEETSIKTSTASASGVPSSTKDEIGSDSEVREKILALLSEKTGYPPDMLDTGLDLEADLGIDTVKQAEFISKVREVFSIPRIEGLKIAEFPTIEHIINFVLQHTSLTPRQGVTQDQVYTFSNNDTDEASIKDKILTLLSEKTGYPSDMLDTNLDLEADLGIDTVKQAEFISEVREAFNIPRIEGLKIAEFPTINHIIEFVRERKQQQIREESVSIIEVKKEPVHTEDVRLYETRLVSLPERDTILRPQAQKTFVVGGPDDLASEVIGTLKDLGYDKISRIQASEIPDNIGDKAVGVINLLGKEKDTLSMKKTFELYLSCASRLENGPSFLVAVVSEDGAFGFENPAVQAEIYGGIIGATKAFSKEYPQCLVRVLDLHPNLDARGSAALIAQSITKNFPLETAIGREGDLRVIRLVPALEEFVHTPLKAEDVLFVTGGAKGITAECLLHLAAQQHFTIVILGRTPLSQRAEQLLSFGPSEWEAEKRNIVDRIRRTGKNPTPVMVEKELARLKGEAEVLQTVRQLRSMGSEVIYRSADIRNPETVDQIVREVAESCGRIDVLIHGAGLDVSRALRSKSLGQMETIFSVKVQGMLNILNSLERHGMPPRRIVGFGSVSGRFGNLAQVDYSAANDGLAHLMRRADRELDAKVSVIDWAPWAEVGMAVRGSVQQTLEAAGIDFIPPKLGAEILSQELTRVTGPVEVLVGGALGPFEADAFHIHDKVEDFQPIFAGQSCRISSFLPQEYVKLTITLDPSHPLLNDHKIDRAAVLPGVGGLEIMRSATALLNPNAKNAILKDVRFRSPLKIFKDDPFEAEVEVIRLSQKINDKPEFYARISSLFSDRSGRKIGSPRIHHECKLLMDSNHDKLSIVNHSDWSTSIWVAAQDIYSVFFHGPAFQFLNRIAIEGKGKAIKFAYNDTKSRSSMFSDALPGGIEAVFQAAAALGMESRGLMFLPTGLKRVTVYSLDCLPHEGELILVGESEEGPDGRLVLEFDGVLKDGNGNSIMELRGVEMIELGASNGFPGKIFEEILPVPNTDVEINELESKLESILTKEEIDRYLSKATPKRKAEWLSGRFALKKAIQRLMTTQNGQGGETICILQDDKGRPYAEFSGKPGVKLNNLSISHSNGLVMAAAAAPDAFWGIGVDLEKVETRSHAWVSDYFSEEEVHMAESHGDKWLTLTKMWCLKEAALKALGVGLRLQLTDISIKNIDESGRATLEFTNQAANHIRGTGSSGIEAYVQERDAVVVARVALRTN